MEPALKKNGDEGSRVSQIRTDFTKSSANENISLSISEDKQLSSEELLTESKTPIKDEIINEMLSFSTALDW